MQTPARASVAAKPPLLKRKIHIALPARQSPTARPFAGGARIEADQELIVWARSILGTPPRGSAGDEGVRQPAAPSVLSGSCTDKVPPAPCQSGILTNRSFAEPPPKRLQTGAFSAFSTYTGAHGAARKSLKFDK